MHFKTAASVAVLACAAHVSARAEEVKPYKLAVMPVPGMSLVRRDTSGYQPEQSQCHEGNTCAEACGTGFTQCPSGDDLVHCFNPTIKQSCCSDNSGNSCDEGYYCTHDTALQTWCCPEAMGLEECAKAFKVTGNLIAATSAPAAATTTSAAAHSTTVAPTTTAAPTTTTAAPTSAEVVESETTVTAVQDETTTVCPETASYTAPAWTGYNNTIVGTAPVNPTQPGPVKPTGTGVPVPSQPGTISGATTSSVSALLLVAAGVIALL